MGLFKADAPDPPDYSGVAAASAEAAANAYEISKEQLAWAKQQYGMDRELADRVVNDMLERSDLQQQWAEQDRERYQGEFQPLEDQLIEDADSYASDDRQQQEAGRAMATVATQFEAARDAATRNLESFGIDPSSTRYGALDAQSRNQQAAVAAGAGNQAVQRSEDLARGLRSEAINIGRGYPGQAAQAAGGALAGGNAAVGANLATTASGQAGMGTGNQWAQTGNQAVGTWGNTLNMGYNNQLAQFNANQNASSGWGSALGLIGGLAFMEDGGEVDDATMGGAVDPGMSPSGGSALDDVPAQLNVGEFVIPKDVVEWQGKKFFHKLIEQSRQADAAPKAAAPEYKPAPARQPSFVSQALPV